MTTHMEAMRRLRHPDWRRREIELRRLWPDAGISASEIARRVGGWTKNGVIGAAHRLGLPKRRQGRPALPRRASGCP